MSSSWQAAAAAVAASATHAPAIAPRMILIDLIDPPRSRRPECAA
jgi:hypothetical protein